MYANRGVGDGGGRKEKAEISVSRGSMKLFYVSEENEDNVKGWWQGTV